MNSRTISAASCSRARLRSEVKAAAGIGVFVLTWLDRGLPFIAIVVLLLFWEGAARLFAIPSFLLPAPSAILAAAIAVPPGIWFGHIWATLRVALMGFGLAVAVSIPLAVCLASSKFLSRTVYPLLVVVQSTPIVAVAPIIVVTLGAGDLPRVVITFLITFFPIVVSTVTGLQSTPEELIELSRSLRAGRKREILHIRLPFAVPHIVSALKISTTLAVIGAVVAEFVAAEKGLGFFIAFSTSNFRIPTAFAGLVILVAISLSLFQAVSFVQRRFVGWSLPKAKQ
jgi:NitT/TauT family transport system permease protein